MNLTREMFDFLAQSLAATRPEEIDCDEWLSRVGRLLDVMQRGEPVPSELEAVLHHIKLCPECDEELQMLVAALKPSH